MGVVFALFIPLGGMGVFPLFGWSIAISRGVIRGQGDVLLVWSGLGPIIVDSLKAAITMFIWNLSGFVLTGIGRLIDAFRRFLHRHGDVVDLSRPIETHFAQHMREGSVWARMRTPIRQKAGVELVGCALEKLAQAVE